MITFCCVYRNAAVVVLFWQVARLFLGRISSGFVEHTHVALAAALLFAFHPVHVEAVAGMCYIGPKCVAAFFLILPNTWVCVRGVSKCGVVSQCVGALRQLGNELCLKGPLVVDALCTKSRLA